jgi:DNA-binding LacI/PurR family transcriptional regulator
MSLTGPRNERRVTSADVARESGVSRATVSYVLNNTEGRRVSEATRQNVLETAARLGHVPNAPARSLRLGRSNIVLALVRDFALGYVSNGVLRRLDLALAARGYIVLAHRFDQLVRPIAELWGLVTPALIVAMGGLTVPEQEIIEGGQVRVLRVHGFVSHQKVGRMQARYLFERGHREFGYAFPADSTLEQIASERLAGVRLECADLGISAPAVFTIDASDPASVFRALDTWSASPAGITAVCSHNDEIAIMLCEALSSRGQTPGTDLAIIGVDDIPTARIALTTIAIDVEAWADAVAAAALAILDGHEPTAPTDDFLRLIVRASA